MNIKSKQNVIYKLIAIVAAVVLLIAGIAIIGYHTFFPAKTTLMLAGYNSSNKLFNTIDANMTLIEDRYLSPLLNSTIQEESRVGVSLNEKLLSLFLPSETAVEVLPYINNIAFKSDRQIDVKNRRQSLEFGLSYLLNPILTTRLSFEDNRFNFGVDELSNKAITGSTEDLDKLSYFFPDVPQEFWDMAESIDPWIGAKILERINIDRTAIKRIIEDYSKEALNSIDSKAMSIKRGQEAEVLGKTIKCKEITVRLDENSQKKLASSIIARLKDDEVFYNLTAGNMLKALDAFGENEYYKELISSYGLVEGLGRDNFIKSLSLLEAEISNSSFSEIVLKVYIDGLDIVKCDLSVEKIVSTDKLVSFVSEQRFNGPSFELGFAIDDSRYYKTTLDIRNDYNQAKDLRNFALKLDIDSKHSDNSMNGTISIDSIEEIIDKNEIDHTINASIEYDIPALVGEGRLNINLDGTKIRDSKKLITERDYKGKLTFDIPLLGPEAYSMGFYYDSEASYGNEITLPEPDEALDLKTATEDDFDQLIEEVSSKINALGKLTGAF